MVLDSHTRHSKPSHKWATGWHVPPVPQICLNLEHRLDFSWAPAVREHKDIWPEWYKTK